MSSSRIFITVFLPIRLSFSMLYKTKDFPRFLLFFFVVLDEALSFLCVLVYSLVAVYLLIGLWEVFVVRLSGDDGTFVENTNPGVPGGIFLYGYGFWK